MVEKRIFNYFLINFLGKVLNITTGILITPILLIVFDKVVFGQIAIVLTIISLYNIFDFGFGKSLTKFIAISSKNKKEYLLISNIYSSSIYLQSFIAFLFISILLFTLNISGLSNTFDIYKNTSIIQNSLIILLFCIFSVNGLGRAIFEGNNSFGEINILRSLFSILTFTSPLIIKYFFDNYQFILVSLIASKAIESLLINILAQQKNKISFLIKPNFKSMKIILKEGFYIMGSNIISLLNEYPEKLIIIYSVGPGAYSAYFVAVELINRSLLILGALITSIFPSESKNIALNKSNNNMDNIYMFTTFFYCALFAIIYYEFNEVLVLIIKDSIYKEISSYAVILFFGLIPYSLSYLIMNKIIAAGNSKNVFNLQCIKILIYIPLLFIAFSKFGIYGTISLWTITKFLECFALLKILESLRFNKGILKIKNLIYFIILSLSISFLYSSLLNAIINNLFVRLFLELLFIILILLLLKNKTKNLNKSLNF